MNDNSFFTPQRMMKIGVALCFDFVKFVFSILFLLAPVLACVASAAAVASYFGAGSWVQGAACAAGGLLTGAFEWATGGLGAAAIQAVGEVLADAIDFMAWALFYIWFFVSGTKFLGGKRATSRLLAGAGTAIIGAVPFLNVLPTITAGVVTIEWQQWKEDQEKAARANSASERDQQLSAQREALAQARAANDEAEAQYLEAA
jgi:hypothetical protein